MRIAILGAGFSGCQPAIELMRSGLSPFHPAALIQYSGRALVARGVYAVIFATLARRLAMNGAARAA